MTDDGFREFVEIRYADLMRTAYLLTGSRHAAEDLVQSALMRVMRRWRQVTDPMAYVRRVMANERNRLWHRWGSREFLAGVTGWWPAGPGRSPDVADDVVVRDEVLAALRDLPPRMRAVLVLRYWEDLSEAEIARTLDCSVGTVKSQASRGLARLRAVLPAGSSSDGQAPLPGNQAPLETASAVTRWRGTNDGR
ncbi:SigE family RNA polymerase sigma factor [Micromonospora sp. NPDC004336]